jgi:hypothetical protein
MTSYPTRQTVAAGSGRRTTFAIVGTFLIVVGGLAAASAIGLIAVFGARSALDSGSHQITSSATAVVTDVASIQHTTSIGAVTGWPTVGVTANGGNGAGVFNGIGPRHEVDRYLSGAAFDEVTDLSLDPFELIVQRHAGEMAASPPAGQDFWVASAESRSSAQLSWKVADGDYRLVVMNADGAPDLVTQTRLQLTLPNAFLISMIVLGSGFLAFVGGVVVLIRAFTSGQRPE